MGIKGIYDILGSGHRISLSKLADESLRDHNQPLKVAIDFAIWQYQLRAAQGGKDPVLRTLLSRSLRLLKTPVQPLFVFDGDKKPKWKRDKLSGLGDKEFDDDAKRLMTLLGIAYHNAPGEAEAECALLQTRGVVDAVLSEDGDTLMFGCTRALSKYSSESKSSPTPTHVNMYDVNNPELLGKEGLILIAMMSGGDYYPQGVPGCGTKMASAAAKAGFGKSLCRLDKSDEQGRRIWRESLMYELRTNTSLFFARKSPAMALEISKGDFPDMNILQYYKHPTVSESLDTISTKFVRKREVDVKELREFTREKLGWDFRDGAIWFIRQLAPVLLVQHMLSRENSSTTSLVEGVLNRRAHWSADATPELKVSYIPAKVVGIDLQQEGEAPLPASHPAPDGEEMLEEPGEDTASQQPTLRKEYNVTKADSIWVLETVARKAVPQLVGEWEEGERAKAQARLEKALSKSKSRTARSLRNTDMPQGAIESFVKYSKALTNIGSSPSGKVPDQIPTREANDEMTTPLSIDRPRFYMLPSSPSPRQSKESSSTRPSKPSLSDQSLGLPEIPSTPTKLVPRSAETIILSSSPPATLDRTPAAAAGYQGKAVMPEPSTPKQAVSRRKKTASSSHLASKSGASPSKQRQLTLDAFTVQNDTSRGCVSSRVHSQGLLATSEEDDGLPSLQVLASLDPHPQLLSSKRLGSPSSSRDNTKTRTRRANKKHRSPDVPCASSAPEAMGMNFSRESSSEGKVRSSQPAHSSVPSDCEVVDLTQDD